tara:strand:- start:1293 stop:1451 length:159 start_codon:yes stop_codon:yes gene_type:complete
MKHLNINDILAMHEENLFLKNQQAILLELISKIKHFQPKMVDDYLREAGIDG